jgi:hypothetical protein
LHLSIHHPVLPVNLENLDMMENKDPKVSKGSGVLKERKAIRGLQGPPEGTGKMVWVSLAGQPHHPPSWGL